MRVAYEKGLHELGDGLHAYLQPDGTWGWSNAGLISAGGTSLLVDTLFDLELTRGMLDAMRAVTERSPIDAAMNTHGNGDHCFGNVLLPDGAEVYATAGAAAEMQAAPPQLVNALKHADALGPEFTAYIHRIFGPFRFDDIELRAPTSTFEGALDLRVGDRKVHLIEVGPAHTDGDVIVHVPDAGVVFTGDIVFHGGHPIVWAGPIANWIAACDRILALDGATTVVPGHGPVTTLATVDRLKGYFEHIAGEARARCDAGMSPLEAAADIDLGPYRDLREPERLVANVAALYREMGADVATDAASIMGLMAAAHRSKTRGAAR